MPFYSEYLYINYVSFAICLDVFWGNHIGHFITIILRTTRVNSTVNYCPKSLPFSPHVADQFFLLSSPAVRTRLTFTKCHRRSPRASTIIFPQETRRILWNDLKLPKAVANRANNTLKQTQNVVRVELCLNFLFFNYTACVCVLSAVFGLMPLWGTSQCLNISSKGWIDKRRGWRVLLPTLLYWELLAFEYWVRVSRAIIF